MDNLLTLSASLCVGLSAMAVFWLFLEITTQIQVEKHENTKQLPLLFKAILPFVPNFLPIVRSAFLERFVKQSREMISMAGYEQIIDEERFVGVNVIFFFFAVFLFIVSIIFKQLFIGLFLAILLIIYPRSWLRSVVSRRHLEIQKALPNVLDLLTLSVEAGKDFLTSLRDILARRRRDALSEELERTFHEIQLGKQRRAALRELALRVQQPDLTVVLNSIVQADELGVSIGQILKIQGDQLRMKRFNRAEKLANEAPVKILFPLVLFIMPAVIIILLGPVLLKGFNILLK